MVEHKHAAELMAEHMEETKPEDDKLVVDRIQNIGRFIHKYYVVDCGMFGDENIICPGCYITHYGARRIVGVQFMETEFRCRECGN